MEYMALAAVYEVGCFTAEAVNACRRTWKSVEDLAGEVLVGGEGVFRAEPHSVDARCAGSQVRVHGRGGDTQGETFLDPVHWRAPLGVRRARAWRP